MQPDYTSHWPGLSQNWLYPPISSSPYFAISPGLHSDSVKNTSCFSEQMLRNPPGDKTETLTPHPSPCSAGVNLFCQDLVRITEMFNPNVFPPFGLIGPVLKFFLPFRIPFTIVVPEFIPHRTGGQSWCHVAFIHIAWGNEGINMFFSALQSLAICLLYVQRLCGSAELLASHSRDPT